MMQGAAMYMQERIEALRRDIDKHGKAKVKKGQQAPPAAKVNPPPFPLPCVPMNYVYVPRLCTTCVVMNHTMQPVLTSLSYMMDGCALPVAVRKEVSCSSVSATCVPAHVAGLPLA